MDWKFCPLCSRSRSPPSPVIAFALLDALDNATVIASGEACHFYFEVTPDFWWEVIISYKSLHTLCVIDENFLIPISRNKVCVNFTSAVNNDTIKDTFAAEANLVRKALCAEFRDVLDGKLPDTPMAGNAMNIFLNDHTDIQPVKVTTTRAIPLHFQAESEKLVWKLLDEGVIAHVVCQQNGMHRPFLCRNHPVVCAW